MSELLSEIEAAAFLHVKPETLQTWRHTKRYPLKFVNPFGRAVRYRLEDLEEFVAEGNHRRGDQPKKAEPKPEKKSKPRRRVRR